MQPTRPGLAIQHDIITYRRMALAVANVESEEFVLLVTIVTAVYRFVSHTFVSFTSKHGKITASCFGSDSLIVSVDGAVRPGRPIPE